MTDEFDFLKPTMDDELAALVERVSGSEFRVGREIAASVRARGMATEKQREALRNCARVMDQPKQRSRLSWLYLEAHWGEFDDWGDKD